MTCCLSAIKHIHVMEFILHNLAIVCERDICLVFVLSAASNAQSGYNNDDKKL